MELSEEESVGSLSTLRHLLYEAIWEIECSSDFLNRRYICIAYSTAFKFYGQEWKFSLLPNCPSETIFVNLMRKGPSFKSPNRKWLFKLRLKCRDGTEKTVSCKRWSLENASNWRYCLAKPLSLSRSLLQDEAASTKNRVTLYALVAIEEEPEMSEASSLTEPDEYNPGGVKCEDNASINYLHESVSGPTRQETMLTNTCLKKLIKDLEILQSSADDSDVILKVQGKEFPSHKTILRARSLVFKSMFSHSMLENDTGVANLDDCNPDTLPDFLKYLYTGKTEHVSVKNVFDLYTVSDKYCIDELKEYCSLFIKRNLSVETFCDSIILALRHDEKELIEAATDFFCRCTAEIVRTPKWQTFLSENPVVGNELFIKSLSSK